MFSCLQAGKKALVSFAKSPPGSREEIPEDKERSARPRAASVADRTRAVAQAAFHRAASVARVSLQKALSPRLSLARASSTELKRSEKTKKKPEEGKQRKPEPSAGGPTVRTFEATTEPLNNRGAEAEPPAVPRKRHSLEATHESAKVQKRENGVVIFLGGADKGEGSSSALKRKTEREPSGAAAAPIPGGKGKEPRKEVGNTHASADSGTGQAARSQARLIPGEGPRVTSADPALHPARESGQEEGEAENDRGGERTSPRLDQGRDASGARRGKAGRSKRIDCEGRSTQPNRVSREKKKAGGGLPNHLVRTSLYEQQTKESGGRTSRVKTAEQKAASQAPKEDKEPATFSRPLSASSDGEKQDSSKLETTFSAHPTEALSAREKVGDSNKLSSKDSVGSSPLQAEDSLGQGPKRITGGQESNSGTSFLKDTKREHRRIPPDGRPVLFKTEAVASEKEGGESLEEKRPSCGTISKIIEEEEEVNASQYGHRGGALAYPHQGREEPVCTPPATLASLASANSASSTSGPAVLKSSGHSPRQSTGSLWRVRSCAESAVSPPEGRLKGDHLLKESTAVTNYNQVLNLLGGTSECLEKEPHQGDDREETKGRTESAYEAEGLLVLSLSERESGEVERLRSSPDSINSGSLSIAECPRGGLTRRKGRETRETEGISEVRRMSSQGRGHHIRSSVPSREDCGDAAQARVKKEKEANSLRGEEASSSLPCMPSVAAGSSRRQPQANTDEQATARRSSIERGAPPEMDEEKTTRRSADSRGGVRGESFLEDILELVDAGRKEREKRLPSRSPGAMPHNEPTGTPADASGSLKKHKTPGDIRDMVSLLREEASSFFMALASKESTAGDGEETNPLFPSGVGTLTKVVELAPPEESHGYGQGEAFVTGRGMQFFPQEEQLSDHGEALVEKTPWLSRRRLDKREGEGSEGKEHQSGEASSERSDGKQKTGRMPGTGTLVEDDRSASEREKTRRRQKPDKQRERESRVREGSAADSNGLHRRTEKTRRASCGDDISEAEGLRLGRDSKTAQSRKKANTDREDDAERTSNRRRDCPGEVEEDEIVEEKKRTGAGSCGGADLKELANGQTDTSSVESDERSAFKGDSSGPFSPLFAGTMEHLPPLSTAREPACLFLHNFHPSAAS